MKLVYTHQNRLLVSHAKSLLDNKGITNTLKNEYASSAAGDLSPIDTWLELWVLQDEDAPLAKTLIAETLSQKQDQPWRCENCEEMNEASFDFCWQCSSEPPLNGV